MASKKSSVKAKKPASIWHKPLKADFAALFKTLSKTVVHAVSGQKIELVSDLAEAATLIGLKTDPGELAFDLVQKAILRSIYDLLSEGSPLAFDTDKSGDIESLMDFSILENEIELGGDFLINPGNLPVVKISQSLLSRWLMLNGIEEKVASAITTRLPSYFVYSLHSLWRDKSKQLQPLREALSTPFGEAAEREDAWNEYSALLHRRANEGAFGEPYGLSDIYIPLNAWCFDKRQSNCNAENSNILLDPDETKTKRHVFDLDTELTSWIEGKDKTTLALRIVSGGPGSGKSTALKILASRWATKGHRVVFIPLHLLPEPSGDVISDVWAYLKELGFFAQNPIESKLQERLVIIFDGLDELASRGRLAAEVAQNFIRTVDLAATLRNENSPLLKIIVTGRELIIQNNETEFGKPYQIVNLLPYYISEEDQKSHPWSDPRKLLKIDLRNRWWAQYGALRGERWKKLPADLNREDLAEVTSQPLLNYLVALTKVRGALDLTKDITINAIYADLVAGVHDRGYEKLKHATVRHMRLSDFVRVLEEVAIAAWHGGDGRLTTVKDIEKHCESSGAGVLLKNFQDGAKIGITRLLAAFFFRRQGHDSAGDDTFEFTHKSFGEYLTACRLTRGLVKIVKEMEERNDSPDEGWDEKQAASYWLSLAGPTPVSPYLYKLLQNEISRKGTDALLLWQETLCRLFGYVLKHGQPMESLNGLRFKKILTYSRNAEESLLAAIAACSLVTEKISHIEFESPVSLGTWFKRIQGQRSGSQNPLAARCLARLNLKGTNWDFADLYATDLSGSDLEGCAAYGTIFCAAKLDGANLTGAHLTNSNFRNASLKRATLREAQLIDVDFTFANLSGATLQKANIRQVYNNSASFMNANLIKCNLSETSIADIPIEQIVQTTFRVPHIQIGEISRAKKQPARKKS